MKSALNKIVFLLAACLLSAAGALSQPVAGLDETVQTWQGTLRGTPRDAQGVLAFKGTPYAAAHTGDLRWHAPQAAKPWERKRNATGFGNRC